VYVFSVLKSASADEITMELIELNSIAARDAVREQTIETTNELKNGKKSC